MNSMRKMKMKLTSKSLLLIGFIGYLGYLLLGMGLQAHAPLKTQIVFVSNRDGSAHIYLMDEDGRNIKRLTKQATFDWISGPRWSPDGQKLAFYVPVDKKIDPVRGWNWDIYTIDPDGKNLRQLTNHPASERFPAWSPDGRHIVFASNMVGKEGGIWNYELYIMDANGENLRRLTHSPAIDAHPDWSPDGQQIVFFSELNNEDGIYVIDVLGQNLRRLTNLPGYERGPRWSPDGKEIVFYGLRELDGEIYIMDADGQNLRNLTNHPAMDETPVWSPDGRQIAFNSKRSGKYEIYVMDAEGGAVRRLTNSPGGVGAGAYVSDWFDPALARAVSPAGKRLLTWGWLKQNGN